MSKKENLEERTARIGKIAIKVFNVLERSDLSNDDAFSVIGVIFTHLMMQCESRDEATFFMNSVNENVCRTMNKVEEIGLSPWDRGTPN